MKKIPPPLKEELNADPDYGYCMKYGHHGHTCDGRITFEHSIIFAGSQLQVKFAILSLCEYGHGVDRFQDGGDLNKEINEWIALSRATEEEIQSINKTGMYPQRIKYLYGKYGGGWVMKYPEKKPEKKSVNHWYPMGDEEWDVVLRLKEHFYSVEGVCYSPHETIKRIMLDRGVEIDLIEKELRED